ncbi:MAG: cytidine deaminase [Firmicutes bacterium]|nr:cytidine deaminase [Bacillota bacterium]
MNEQKLDIIIASAEKARAGAYAPYSGFAVGAALLAEDGQIFAGANLENASSSLTICAERVAVFTAVSAGYYNFLALAVTADSPEPVFPCGSCRQVLWELAGDIQIIAANLEHKIIITPLSNILPHPFVTTKISSPRRYFGR